MSELSAPPPIPSAPPSPPRKRRGIGVGWILILAVAGLIGLGLMMAFVASRFLHGGSTHAHGSGRLGAAELVETTLEDNGSEDKVAVIEIQGVISGESPGGGRSSLVDEVRDQLQRIEDDEAVKAVILRVDSPGGEVLASDEIYEAIRHFQSDTEIPVVASMGSLAASGGYYVSTPCRWIVAHPLSLTGSIGVIFHGYNYRGLMDKVGVRPDVVKSGKLKDMFSGELRMEDELPEEKIILKNLVAESFSRFKQVIQEGRDAAAKSNQTNQVTGGRTLAPNWEEFADGRILSGKQALDLGLVDELGSMETAISRAMSLADIESANLITYQSRPHISDLLRLLGKSEVDRIQVDVGGFNPLAKLPQGRLYFLSPIHLH
ncbi:MAG: signal peptide peptidase SppA [Verrucomicrobiota bacterium]